MRIHQMGSPGRSKIGFLFLFFIQLFPAIASLSSDLSALLKFKDGIEIDPSGQVTDTWKENNVGPSGCPLPTWYGVVCSNGAVNALQLPDLGLFGRVSANTLGRLSKLSALDLGNNSFVGSLPEDIGDLVALQRLDLSHNRFNGTIPFFSKLSSLQNLSLSVNHLSGSIPDMFSSMPLMTYLDLSANFLTGSIPPTLPKLNRLVYLNLSCNQIVGHLPSDLTGLQNLQIIDIHKNNLSGGIDQGWMNLTKIQTVDFSCNQFSGVLPWGQDLLLELPQSIVHVNLSYNHLEGALAPDDAASLFATNLQVLDISNNRLTGKLPSFEFVYLLTLRLQNNFFIGEVPPAFLGSQSPLQELDLRMNQLEGRIDTILAPRLNILRLSSNRLNGSLPKKLKSCAIVDLSNNSFSGDLAAMKTWPNSLQMLDLSINKLSGVLPNETAQLLRLMYLNLSNNMLSGPVPNSYGLFEKLIAIDLSRNQLEGSVPVSFFHSLLGTLRLSHNQFTGSIPLGDLISSSSLSGQSISSSSTSPFSPLIVLDVSWNQLSGSIPQEIGSLTLLEVLHLQGNDFSGYIPFQLTQLDYLQDLDLSQNHLTGPIPWPLTPQLRMLNLSYNDLTGKIPIELERRFPWSSFHPGNSKLVSSFPGFGPPGGFGARRHGLSPAVKAGLIGGCTAGAFLILVAALLIYYRRVSSYPVIVKSMDKPSSKPPSPYRHETTSRVIPPASYTNISFSREQLLPPPETPAFVKPRMSPKHKNVLGEGSDSTRSDIIMETSPSRKRHKVSQDISSPSMEHPIPLKVRSPDKLAGDLFLLDHGLIFTAEELSRAPAEVLGRSSHGTSYKATLDNGHVLTVKWLREGLAKSKREFTSEARKFGSIRHPNIIPLRGYYWGPREHEKLILSDYIPFGSLAVRLSERSGRRYPLLTWPQRLQIAADIARGLNYLHHKHRLPHGNLKATNVLLDGSDPTARLSDYCIHQLMTSAGTANQILNAGALGYRAPELANARKPKPTLKADVYAFGVILMEILSGKGAGDIISGNSGAVDLTDWVKLLVNDGRTLECYDQNLIGYDSEQEAPRGMDDVLAISLRCISSHATRPGIKEVYDELIGVMHSFVRQMEMEESSSV